MPHIDFPDTCWRYCRPERRRRYNRRNSRTTIYAVGIGRRDREHFRISCRISRPLGVVVAACRDEDDVVIVGVFDGVVQKLGLRVVAETHINYFGAVVGFLLATSLSFTSCLLILKIPPH